MAATNSPRGQRPAQPVGQPVGQHLDPVDPKADPVVDPQADPSVDPKLDPNAAPQPGSQDREAAGASATRDGLVDQVPTAPAGTYRNGKPFPLRVSVLKSVDDTTGERTYDTVIVEPDEDLPGGIDAEEMDRLVVLGYARGKN